MGASVCIEQKGTVEDVSRGRIRVKIHREASCGACSARGLCYMGEDTERVYEISDFTDGIKSGDIVGISISRSMGNKAIFLSYLLPFMLMITTLLVSDSLGMKEWFTGIMALGILIPYFIIIYLLRNRFRKTFTLSARKNED